jgi:putative ABC transport system permease protein
MALGARREAVLELVVVRGVLLTASGVVFGITGALGVTRVLRSYLFQVAPGDPGVLFGAATVLMGVTLMATWLPARRASRVDPMVALRYE